MRRQRCITAAPAGVVSVILMPCLLLSLIAVPDALAGEWESMRESYDNKLRAHAKRIAEIEAKERGASADPEKRADKITRDRIAEIRASLKGGGRPGGWRNRPRRRPVTRGRWSTCTEDRASTSTSSRSEWGADGAERKKLREVHRRDAEEPRAGQCEPGEGGRGGRGDADRRVPQSGVLEKVARIEAGASETRERLSARWERERAAREREREQREREAAERARGLR